MRRRYLLPVLFLVAGAAPAAQSGKDTYQKTCNVCHATGIAGAPRYGNAADWTPRLAGGTARLHASAVKGTAKGMPARGGNTALSDSEVAAAVDYVLASVKGAPAPAREEPKQAPKPSPAVATGDAGRLEAKAESKPGAAAVTPAPGSQAVAIAGASPADVNAFNRLLKPVGKRNPPPAEDGIHDPTNDGTHALLPPMAAYGDLPKSLAGNRVNWVTAIAQKKINPRWDRNDEKAEAMVMDMNIVREVKGSMPDVVYPHKQHTEWLDCSNCHPAIFVPQKGANSISMAAILLGEKCGVCHGKVAFPVSECRLCHSKKKEMPRAQATATGK
jgi:c(7)-type cytochrome triheme protein